jgi:hypothetical protein
MDIKSRKKQDAGNKYVTRWIVCASLCAARTGEEEEIGYFRREFKRYCLKV